MRILLVEDAEDIADAIRVRLAKAGYAVDMAENGEAAEDLLATETYQLIVLDLMLGRGVDGQTILQRLRKRGDTTPVLVVTARSQVDCKINVLDIGADDYLVKPFDLGELEARCRALLRRSRGHAAAALEIGNLVFDTSAKSLTVAGAPIEVGAREFRLLEILIVNIGRVMSKEALIGHLFSLDQAVAPNAIELYISRLRRKLEGASLVIRTVHGMGYIAERRGDEPG
jgi:two-component system response regulator TctD